MNYRYKFGKRIVLVAALLVGVTGWSAAEESSDEKLAPSIGRDEVDEPTTLRLGVGALTVPDFEGARDQSVFPVPIIELRNWYNFDISAREVSYRLYEYRNDAESEFKKFEFRIAPTLSPSASRMEDDDFLFFARGNSKYLRGLGDVDPGVDLGARFTLRTGPVFTRLALRQEITGGHDGFTAELGVGTRVPLSDNTLLSAELAATWADDSYMDSFFSIDRGQAFRSRYRRFDADAGIKDGSIGLSLFHDFNDRVSFIGTARYTRLFGDAARSPLVEGPGGSRDQFTALMGLTYKWSF